MDEIQALVLKKKLEKLEAWTIERQNIAKEFNEGLQVNEKIELVNSLQGNPVFHQYVIQVNNRDVAKAFFQDAQIETSIHYPIPVHKQRALMGRFIQGSSLKVTEELTRNILSIPIFPGMQRGHIERVVEALSQCP
jgi:dTDP-4-amino-4,6-dideoxygalactose transaminase